MLANTIENLGGGKGLSRKSYSPSEVETEQLRGHRTLEVDETMS